MSTKTSDDMETLATCLPCDEVLAEQAYLVARGVRQLSLAGHCHLPEGDPASLLAVATRIERYTEPNVIPFVVDHGNGVASYGYSESRWVLDLYEWAVKDPSVPQEQRHRIIGLLLGYGAPAVSRHEEEGSGRRFAAATTASCGSDASWPLCGSASRAGTSPQR
jgi:hypothetical protein